MKNKANVFANRIYNKNSLQSLQTKIQKIIYGKNNDINEKLKIKTIQYNEKE